MSDTLQKSIQFVSQIMYSEPNFSSLDSSTVDLDWQQLSQLSEGNSEFELELLQMFAEDIPIYLEEIEKAIADKDCKNLKRIAHQIKGSSGNVGAKAMEEVAAKIESSSSNSNLAALEENVKDLEVKFARVKDLIAEKYEND